MPSSSFTFNDLPTDIQSLTFHHLNSIERALVLATCQEWYQLIMRSRTYWMDLEIGEDCSFERLMKMLKAFTARSQNSMRSVVIDKLMEGKVKLEMIFDVVTLSSSSIRILSIRQRGKLNSLTRHYARSLPKLYLLSAQETLSSGFLERFENSVPIASQSGLSHYETRSLFDVQEEEMDWLSHLVTLKIGESSIRDTLSILKRNTSTLKSLEWTYGKGLEDQTFEPLVFEVLLRLFLPTHYLRDPTLNMPLLVPKLRSLKGHISQLRLVVSPSISHLTIVLEKETEWTADQTGNFLKEIEGVFSQFPLVRMIRIAGFYGAFPLQLERILEALHWSTTAKVKPLVPHLRRLSVHHPRQMTEMDGLVDFFFNRQEYRRKKGKTERFEIEVSGAKENQLRFDEALRKRQAIDETSPSELTAGLMEALLSRSPNLS